MNLHWIKMTGTMNPERQFLFGLIFCVAVLTCAGFAGQKEVAAVIEQASRLADVWEKNGSAFHLKADLTFYDERGTTQQGTYEESWASAGQWRRETVVGPFHRIDVAVGDKRWSLDSSALPITAYQLRSILAPWSLDAGLLEKAKIEEKSWHGQAVRCVVIEAYPAGRSAVCVDKGSGALALKIEPVKHEKRIGDEVCEYSDYQKFGEKIFPRLVRCIDGNRLTLELRITELKPADKLSTSLFAPVDGATESFNCQGILRPPRLVSSPDPVPPTAKDPGKPVELLVMLGKNGKPQQIKVIRSIDSAFDAAAMSAVRNWRFKPAGCEDEPIDFELHVVIEFHIK
jgi:TonB family protein